MKKILGHTTLIILLLLIAIAIAIPTQAQKKTKIKKEIAITFNELPASQGFKDVDANAVTYLTLQALKKHNVKAVGFVIGDQIGSNFDLLGQWLNEGHRLGNMTLTNQDLNQIGYVQFIEDIAAGDRALEDMLNGFGQKSRYFRYPYLHYGNSADKKDEVRSFLDSHRYKIGHATVLVDDYLYNLSLEKMGKEPDSAQFLALLNEYINHVLDQIEASEMNSMEMLNRNCRQILQLTANRLNAVYLDDMLTAIEDMGYKIISLDKALDDELYHEEEAYFGSRGVGYLDMIKLSNPDFLPAEY